MSTSVNRLSYWAIFYTGGMFIALSYHVPRTVDGSRDIANDTSQEVGWVEKEKGRRRG